MSNRRCKHPIAVWRQSQIRPFETAPSGVPLFMVTQRCGVCFTYLPIGPAVDDGPTVTPEAAADRPCCRRRTDGDA